MFHSKHFGPQIRQRISQGVALPGADVTAGCKFGRYEDLRSVASPRFPGHRHAPDSHPDRAPGMQGYLAPFGPCGPSVAMLPLRQPKRIPFRCLRESVAGGRNRKKCSVWEKRFLCQGRQPAATGGVPSPGFKAPEAWRRALDNGGAKEIQNKCAAPRPSEDGLPCGAFQMLGVRKTRSRHEP